VTTTSVKVVTKETERFNRATINPWQQKLQTEVAMELEFAYSSNSFSKVKKNQKQQSTHG